MKVTLASCALFITFIKYSASYIQLTVENEDLCSPTKKSKIRLEKGSRSSLIVNQTRLNDHPLNWQFNMKCRFQVTPATSREGIIAVIQDLSFRKDAVTDECIDYVQFSRKDGSSSRKYCGKFNAALRMDHNFANPIEPISSGTAFVDEKGELDVTIYVTKEKLTSEEDTDLNIVFTAYKPCSQVFKRDISYKPCSEDKTEYCIYSGFFLDSYINCPLPDCVDEGGCSKATDVTDYYYGNKILIGAVSSVFVVFALFILCLWVCKTYKIFCWSRSFANPGSTTPQNQPREPPRVIEMNEQSSPRSSVPPPDSSTNPIDEDKDLPPSYDSLFPQR